MSSVHLLADALIQQGVHTLFGVPGSGTSLQLISALEERGVSFVGATHEAAGALMAGAYGRQTGSLGCCISIKGPGFANMLPGIIANAYEQLPVLSIAEAYGPTTAPSQMHKRLDHRALAAGVTKAYATINDPLSTLSQLVACATAEYPGPVHLDLVFDSDAAVAFHQNENEFKGHEASDWDRLRTILAGARRPALVVGSLATRRPWEKTLNTLRLPILTTVAAKGIVDEQTPFAAGIFTGAGKVRAPEQHILGQADLIVGIGLRNLEVLTARAFGVPLVLIDEIDGNTSAGFGADVFVTSSSPDVIENVWTILSAIQWGEDTIAETRSSLDEYLIADPWLPGTVFRQLQSALPHACLVVDTGSFCTVAEHIWRATSPHDFVASANGRYMGTGLPMAIGAAIADTTRPTICAVGDGGMRMYVAEVKLAIELHLPLLILLMTDGRYGSIACAPSARGMSTRAVTIPRPSWYQAIAALGCTAAQTHSLDQLMDVVGAWHPSDGPLFVEAVFDPGRYARMTDDVR